MLLVTPAFALTYSHFYYTNPGYKAYMNIVNNNDQAIFNITSYNGHVPIAVNGTDAYFNANVSWIGGFQSYVLSPLGNKTIHWGYFNQTTAYFENATGYEEIMKEMASTYLITGTGANDMINITSGVFADIFSIVAPGFGSNVNVWTSSGDATYAIQVGLNGTVSISPIFGLSNMTSATIGVFNIVYDSNNY
jgi:hypothetical protein